MSTSRLPRPGKLLITTAGLLLLAYGGISMATATDKTDKPPPRATHRLVKSVISAGGIPGSDWVRLGNGSLGQSTPIGIGSSQTVLLSAGFWYGQVQPVSDLPDQLRTALYQNFPNPFNPMTTIRYVVAQESLVDAAVFDARGRRVRTLVHEVQPAGVQTVVWDGKDRAGRQVATGLYFYRLRAGDYTAVKKMLLMK